MKQTLTDLYIKYQNSGISDQPIISDGELKDLYDKLKEFIEFCKLTKNAAMVSYFQIEYNNIWCIIEARKN